MGFSLFQPGGLTERGLVAQGVVFYRYTLTAIFLLPFVIRKRRHRAVILWGMLAGAKMGMGWIGYVTALKTAPASTMGALHMAYPVFTMLIAWILLADPRACDVAGRAAWVWPGDCVLVHRLSRIAPLARIGAVEVPTMFAVAVIAFGNR